ncbi:MAG TPA: hypothetical protein VF973_15535 [Myxococcales bacterium]
MTIAGHDARSAQRAPQDDLDLKSNLAEALEDRADITSDEQQGSEAI